jgi:hypothetical protein
LLIWQKLASSPSLNRVIKFFQDNVAPPVLLEVFGAFVWGYLLGKISGYRRWWLLSAVGITGVRVGDYALYNGFLERWVQGHTPPGFPGYLSFGLILGISVLCVTVSIALLLGLVLMNWKASMVLAVSTGTTSVIGALAVWIILDRLGIRIGSGNLAMPKAAAGATMAAALAGGAILSTLFSRYVRARSFQ